MSKNLFWAWIGLIAVSVFLIVYSIPPRIEGRQLQAEKTPSMPPPVRPAPRFGLKDITILASEQKVWLVTDRNHPNECLLVIESTDSSGYHSRSMTSQHWYCQ